MYVVHEWTGRTELFQNYFFLEPFRFTFFLSQVNEKSLEILFIWTLTRRVRNARNSQEIPFSWTFQFVDAAGICLLQAQPMSKCTEFPKNCVHSTPVWPVSQMNRFHREFHSFGKKVNRNGSQKKVNRNGSVRPVHSWTTYMHGVHRIHA